MKSRPSRGRPSAHPSAHPSATRSGQRSAQRPSRPAHTRDRDTRESSAGGSEGEWIWGLHSVQAALERCPELVLELQWESASERELTQKLGELAESVGVAPKLMKALPRSLQEKRTQGVAARLKQFPFEFWERFDDERLQEELLSGPAVQLALLDGVQDPRNYGAILRSAAAFGLAGVLVGRRDQSPLTGVVAQASAGNLFRVHNLVCGNLGKSLETLQEVGSAVAVGLDAEGEPMEAYLKHLEPTRPLVWVLGSEGEGLRPGLKAKCDVVLKIPMAEEVESLNVSAAATVAFYAAKTLRPRG